VSTGFAWGTLGAVDQPIANEEAPRNEQVSSETNLATETDDEFPLPMTPRFVRRTGPL
jgi:hypothetical protein